MKLVSFESLDAVSYSPSMVTMAVSVAVCELFSIKACDLGHWIRGPSRSLTMAAFDRPYATFYWSAIAKLYLVPFSNFLTSNNIMTLKSGLEVTRSH